MTTPTTPEAVCPACSAPGAGRFCANCGSLREGATCAGCETPLTPGSKFCHRCGRAAGTAPAVAATPARPGAATSGGISTSLPWIVAAIALVVLLAFLGGNRFNASRGSSLDAPVNALPQAGLDDRGAATPGAPGEAAIRGPDISSLSPQERADRLFNRVMTLNSQGKTDSVQFFAPMAIEAYRLLSPLDADQRYDMGQIAEVAGALPLASAQADTILQKNPTHLLGLILSARLAALKNDTAARRSYEARLLAAFTSESAKRLPEYLRHDNDITSAIAIARRTAGRTE